MGFRDQVRQVAHRARSTIREERFTPRSFAPRYLSVFFLSQADEESRAARRGADAASTIDRVPPEYADAWLHLLEFRSSPLDAQQRTDRVYRS